MKLVFRPIKQYCRDLNLEHSQNLESLLDCQPGVLMLTPSYIQAFLHPIHLDDENSHSRMNSDAPQEPKGRLVSWAELSEHNTRKSVWVLIDGEVYDATEIVDIHPGGVGPLMKQAGQDAT